MSQTETPNPIELHDPVAKALAVQAAHLLAAVKTLEDRRTADPEPSSIERPGTEIRGAKGSSEPIDTADVDQGGGMGGDVDLAALVLEHGFALSVVVELATPSGTRRKVQLTQSIEVLDS